jgi:hypothetical protein
MANIYKCVTRRFPNGKYLQVSYQTLSEWQIFTSALPDAFRMANIYKWVTWRFPIISYTQILQNSLLFLALFTCKIHKCVSTTDENNLNDVTATTMVFYLVLIPIPVRTRAT